MAASNPPKHDFAPAWLKIPSTSTAKPAGTKSTSHQQDRTRQRRDENYYNRFGAEYPRQLNRQNSFDVYDASKRYSPSHGGKYRHHSVEDDYYYYGYGYYNNYSYDPYPMQFGSQPSLLRNPGRDTKYLHQSSGFSQMNGSYSGYYYYDFYPSGEGYANYSSNGQSNSKRAQFGREGRGESKDSKDSDRSSHDDEKEKPFNDDFPSLNGTDADPEPKSIRSASAGGVWDNPPKSKFEDSCDLLKSSSSGIYKALVPGKGTNSRRSGQEAARVNGNLRDLSPLASTKSGSSQVSSREQSPTPPIEILSSRLVRQPKPLGDKKSQFLKALRKDADGDHFQNGLGHSSHENNNNTKQEGKELDGKDMEGLLNGFLDLQLDPGHDHLTNGDMGILSSSLEAEQRLLREMGWDEEDDEVYEITEDDKREFKQLTDKLQQKQMRNGLARTLPKAWSPQHIAPYKARPQDLNETLSSSDTDSDEDVCT